METKQLTTPHATGTLTHTTNHNQNNHLTVQSKPVVLYFIQPEWYRKI